MKKILTVAFTISAILLILDIVSVIYVKFSISDGAAFVKEIFYAVAIIIAIICIVSMVIAHIKMNKI